VIRVEESLPLALPSVIKYCGCECCSVVYASSYSWAETVGGDVGQGCYCSTGEGGGYDEALGVSWGWVAAGGGWRGDELDGACVEVGGWRRR
jgi:hypothetical protein